MAGTVGNICNKVKRCTLGVAEKAVNCLDDYLDDVYVLPLVEATDVVGVGCVSVVENDINGTGMVNYI